MSIVGLLFISGEKVRAGCLFSNTVSSGIVNHGTTFDEEVSDITGGGGFSETIPLLLQELIANNTVSVNMIFVNFMEQEWMLTSVSLNGVNN